MAANAPTLLARPPLWRRVVGAERLACAALCAVALVFRFQWGLGSVTFEPANFFAYLTIQSNIAYALVAAAAGVFALRGAQASPRFDALRAAVLTCTVTAGIVFAVIVQQSAARGIRVDVPWSDVVLHFVLPLAAVIDWMLTQRHRVRLTVVVLVLAYVGLWGAVTILRGEQTGWYPYYFLDPIQTRNALEFVVISGAAVAVFATIGASLILARVPSRVWTERRAPGFEAPPRARRRRSPRPGQAPADRRPPQEAPPDPSPEAD